MTKNELNPEAMAKGWERSGQMRFSYAKIALATGYSERQIRRDQEAGEFTFDDLLTLMHYILASPKGQEQEARYAVPADKFPPQQLP